MTSEADLDVHVFVDCLLPLSLVVVVFVCAEYYYIGGYYGASTEQLMMEEILTNGPISVSFEVYDDFMNYAGGVYTHQFTQHLASTYNPFQLVNHAVLAVGWGVTDDANQTPYWIVKVSSALRTPSRAPHECAADVRPPSRVFDSAC
jgi:hypothetical protein